MTNPLQPELVMAILHTPQSRQPWNKGKLIGQKAPLKLKYIWAIRIRLQLGHKIRDLALFNLAIDSRLRACDLMKLWVRPSGANPNQEEVRRRCTRGPAGAACVDSAGNSGSAADGSRGCGTAAVACLRASFSSCLRFFASSRWRFSKA